MLYFTIFDQGLDCLLMLVPILVIMVGINWMKVKRRPNQAHRDVVNSMYSKTDAWQPNNKLRIYPQMNHFKPVECFKSHR